MMEFNLKESIIELNARERVQSILDEGSFYELLNPFERIESPHLQKQGIIPQSDDGVCIARGTMGGRDLAVISIEGEFQGGGIGEVSGSKIARFLERTLKSCKNGNIIIPVIFFDTGGVRLQEANYGLMSIAEIQAAIVALRRYVPVIAVLPGKIGSFGGMGITAGLCSAIIMTKQARFGLNGPEVIEQEAGIREFDASDRILTWQTIGGQQRKDSQLADFLIEDDLIELKEKLAFIMEEGYQSKRTKGFDFYLSILNQLQVDEKLEPNKVTDLYSRTERLGATKESRERRKSIVHSRGRKWFELFCGEGNISELPSLMVADKEIDGNKYRFIAVVPDDNNIYPRVRNGELGLREGWYIAKYVWEAIEEDEGKDPRVIVPIVDVPGQAYGYNEELLGLHQSCAASVYAYASARENNHKVITFIPGKAISGAFLSHGLQGNQLIALNDKEVNVHVMSKKSAALITRRTLEELESATKDIPAMAYDVESFETLGGLSRLLEGINADAPQEDDKNTVLNIIKQCVGEVKESKRIGVSSRLERQVVKDEGNAASIFVRERIGEQWK